MIEAQPHSFAVEPDDDSLENEIEYFESKVGEPLTPGAIDLIERRLTDYFYKPTDEQLFAAMEAL